MARVLARYGPPPLWARSPGFATLVYIILEQQVSLTSAKITYQRFCDIVQPLTPQNVLNMTAEQVQRIGLTRQKNRYCRELAQAILVGQLNLEALTTLDDDTVRAQLTQVVGIGHWTADVYLLMVLLRPNILPKGDIALYAAAQSIKRLGQRPNYEEFSQLAEAWQPHRATAARILWHHYLCERAK